MPFRWPDRIAGGRGLQAAGAGRRDVAEHGRGTAPFGSVAAASLGPSTPRSAASPVAWPPSGPRFSGVSHGATLSHQTAAELDGIITKAAPMIHVTVSSGLRLARIPGVRLHYSGHLALARHPVRQPPPRGNAR